MKTPQWIKKLAGRSGELYISAELSKRGIVNTLLPDNFSDNDILVANKEGSKFGYIQVKSCHPDRGTTFRLGVNNEKWNDEAKSNEFVAFVWLGSAKNNKPPSYWLAMKKDVGKLCKECRPPNPENRERRFAPAIKSGLAPRWKKFRLNSEWRSKWELFDYYKT